MWPVETGMALQNRLMKALPSNPHISPAPLQQSFLCPADACTEAPTKTMQGPRLPAHCQDSLLQRNLLEEHPAVLAYSHASCSRAFRGLRVTTGRATVWNPRRS